MVDVNGATVVMAETFTQSTTTSASNMDKRSGLSCSYNSINMNIRVSCIIH